LLANPSALVPRAEGLAACFDRLFGELREQGPGHRGQVHAHLAELLLSTARLVARPREPEPDDSLVRGALAGIGARLDEPWSLATMAATAGLGRSRFSERVLELTGLTPKRWLEQQRLLHARRLLEGNASVTEIAFRVGYSSSQYFATAFRRDSGMSPLEWRSRRRHEENRRAPPA
jgi:AraC-like DNA-binding protein